MANTNGKKDTRWLLPLSEWLIVFGFVLLVAAGIVTVVLPELQNEPNQNAKGGQVSDHAKK
jgi:hypothetical protein